MTYDRIPPQDLDAERFVLGACLLGREFLNTAVEILCPADFFDLNNRTAFSIITAMHADGKEVNNSTFIDALKKHKMFESLGGQMCIEVLKMSGVAMVDVEYYAYNIKEQTMRRRLIDAGSRIACMGYAPNTDIKNAKIIVDAEHILVDVSDKSEEA